MPKKYRWLIAFNSLIGLACLFWGAHLLLTGLTDVWDTLLLFLRLLTGGR